MRVLLFIFLAGICILLPLSCPAPGGGDGLPDYYILFYIDGQRYVFEKGLTDIETVPFAGHWGATHTVIFATPDTGTSADYINSNLSAHIYLGFEDWYENANDTPGQTGEFVLEFLDYYDGGTDTLYQLKFDIDTPDTATVTANAAVGGTIVGTFAGTVEHNGRELEITNGVFRVKRADIMF